MIPSTPGIEERGLKYYDLDTQRINQEITCKSCDFLFHPINHYIDTSDGYPKTVDIIYTCYWCQHPTKINHFTYAVSRPQMNQIVKNFSHITDSQQQKPRCLGYTQTYQGIEYPQIIRMEIPLIPFHKWQLKILFQPFLKQ